MQDLSGKRLVNDFDRPVEVVVKGFRTLSEDDQEHIVPTVDHAALLRLFRLVGQVVREGGLHILEALAHRLDHRVLLFRLRLDGKQVVGVSYPCLVTFTKPNFDPRFPTIKRKMAARKAVIEQITAADLEGIDLSRAGLKGSPTKVKRTYVPPRKKSGVMITGETPEECAAKLYEALNSAHII